MEWMITTNEPGKTYLMQGNEAISRGALEAGIRFAAAYPGSPSSEILTMLGHVADEMEIYAEWSTNETCALEACLGASFAGIRSLCVMKQNGLLVVGDALHSASLSGVKGGLVLVVADDPSAHSSTNEFDSRHQSRSAAVPMLEPANMQEISEETRLSKNEVKLLKEGLPLEIIDETLGKIWVVHPFRFQVDTPEKIQIDWEHSECRWIEPEEIKNYNTVPGLYSAWERVK
jgi:hypothetical protein